MLFQMTVIDYLVFGGTLAFLNGVLVAFSSSKVGRTSACVLAVYMSVFIFAYPAWIDYAVSIGIFDYTILSPLLRLNDSCVVYTIFAMEIWIPIYTIYSAILAIASVSGLTIPSFRGIALSRSLMTIFMISLVSAIFLGPLSTLSLFQLVFFGSLCLFTGVYLYWDEREDRMLAKEAKRYYAFIESKGKISAKEVMHGLNIKDEKKFSRVMQKLLDENWVIATEWKNEIWLSVAQKPDA